MTRREFEELVLDTYNIKADYPFEDDLITGAFRHGNGKWFALAMNVERRKLGIVGDGQIDVVNFKCAPEVIESIAGIEAGVYRAYHMNKTHWLTVALDGSCDDGTVAWLLSISYDLTKGSIKKPKRVFSNEEEL